MMNIFISDLLLMQFFVLLYELKKKITTYFKLN